MKSVNVGICGLGTVGSGTLNVLSRNADLVNARAACPIRVVQVASRRLPDDLPLDGIDISTDIFAVARNSAVDIVVELIGGTDVAYELVMEAIAHGKHVVTANKALIAEFGHDIFNAARKKGVVVAFEASVAGGIPIIKSLREGLGANRIQWLAGIINGTTNYILTAMQDEGRDFAEVLQEAQDLGYAEADPTFDVEGVDAAHKLVILASLAFGIPLPFNRVYTEGISNIDLQDIAYAREIGYRIKHLGIARNTEDGIELRVHPTLVPEKSLIAEVDGVMNSVMVRGDAVGPTLFYGAGAGAEPTASSVVADVIDVARSLNCTPESRVPYLAFMKESLSDHPILPMEQVNTAYYLRMSALDKPGVLSEVAQIMSNQGISIEAIIQKQPTPGQDHVTLIMLTNRAEEGNLLSAVRRIEGLTTIAGNVVQIRVESLDQ